MIEIHDGRYLLTSASSNDRIFIEVWNAPSGNVVIKTADTACAKKYKMGGTLKRNGEIAWAREMFGYERAIADCTPAQLRVRRAIKTFLAMDVEARLVAGEAYAETTGKCCICNRQLTAEQSVIRGMGPICAERILGKAVA